MKRLDVERHLRESGCQFWREGANHAVWWNPSNRKMTSLPRHREIKPGTVRAMCRELEIPKPDKIN